MALHMFEIGFGNVFGFVSLLVFIAFFCGHHERRDTDRVATDYPAEK